MNLFKFLGTLNFSYITGYLFYFFRNIEVKQIEKNDTYTRPVALNLVATLTEAHSFILVDLPTPIRTVQVWIRRAGIFV